MAKAPPKADAKTEALAQAPAGRSKKKLFLILGIAVAVLGGGGASAWYFIQKDTGHKEAKTEPAKPPIFINMEPFTVNLQPEGGEQYLQVAFTLQVPDNAQTEVIKLHMPQVRSRLLLLLSGKKASEISSVEGKHKLAEEIINEVNKPFNPKGKPQAVSGVFFTSFVIQ